MEGREGEVEGGGEGRGGEGRGGVHTKISYSDTAQWICNHV